MSVYKRFLAQALFLLIALNLATSAHAQNDPTTAVAAKVVQLLNGTGYKYVTRTPTVWYIDMNRSSLKNFRLILASNENLVVVFVTVLKKQQMQMTPEFTQTLLRLNDQFDYVKIGIDKDGDVFVRTDCSPRVMDAQELKTQIDQVAAASNELYEKSQPFLVK